MPDRRPLGDQHDSLETHWRPTCLIGDPTETNMSDQRPIGDPSETQVILETNWRPKCQIGERHAWSETHRDQHVSSETDMPHQKPTLGKICISYWSLVRHVCLWWVPMRHVGLQWGMLVSDGSSLRYVGLQSGKLVSDQTCWSAMGLRWGMLVFDEACRSPMRNFSLWWVSNRSPIGLQWVSVRFPI